MVKVETYSSSLVVNINKKEKEEGTKIIKRKENMLCSTSRFIF